MSILNRIDKIVNEKDNEQILRELSDYFGVEINENMGDGIIKAIKKRIKDVKDACKYIVDMCSKVAKNTGDKERKMQVKKEAEDVLKELNDLEKITEEMLEYMFGDSELGGNIGFK